MGGSPVAPQDLDGVQRHARGVLGSIQDDGRAVLAVGMPCKATEVRA